MFGEKGFGLAPHFFGKYVAGGRRDEGGKILRDTGRGVGFGDGLHAVAGFFYRGATVGFAKV